MSKEENNRAVAIVGTVLFHALLLMAFLLFALSTPLPLPGEEGVEVNLGYTDEGAGISQQPASQPAPAPRPEPTPQKEELVTQKTEETAAIPAQKEKITQPKPKPEPPKKGNPQHLYKRSTPDNQNGQGDGAGTQPGDQGKPDGSQNSQSQEGLGGAGEGISANLTGRTATHLPEPEYLSREQGKVVVSIWVDNDGRVVRAQAGAQGTTTTDPVLRKAAEEAARKARFTANPNAPDEQRGFITYIFLRQN